MDDTFYVISRGYEGKALTSAQRKSSLFAEEPVVMGKILRRGSKPFRLTPAEFEANKDRLRQLEAAGAIKIQVPTLAPDMTESQTVAINKQRAEAEAAALAALEADNKAKELKEAEDLKAAEELKAVEAAKEVEKVETPAEVAPETAPAEPQDTSTPPPPPPSAPKAEKKSHGSKKGKG